MKRWGDKCCSGGSPDENREGVRSKIGVGFEVGDEGSDGGGSPDKNSDGGSDGVISVGGDFPDNNQDG